MGLVDSTIVRFLPAVPKPVVRKISERYIAGEELDDALVVVRRLNDQGKLATIDVLGEEITSPDEARAIAAAYRESLDAFERGKLGSNVSVKPTGLGLKLGYDLCKANLEDVVRHAAELGNFVRIDMEDASTTDDTLRLYRELRDAGFDNVGIVLQSALYRTDKDVREGIDGLLRGVGCPRQHVVSRERHIESLKGGWLVQRTVDGVRRGECRVERARVRVVRDGDQAEVIEERPVGGAWQWRSERQP